MSGSVAKVKYWVDMLGDCSGVEARGIPKAALITFDLEIDLGLQM